MTYNILTHRDYAEAAERIPMDGGSDSARDLPLLCLLLYSPPVPSGRMLMRLLLVKLVSYDTNVRVNRMAILLEGNMGKYAARGRWRLHSFPWLRYGE